MTVQIKNPMEFMTDLPYFGVLQKDGWVKTPISEERDAPDPDTNTIKVRFSKRPDYTDFVAQPYQDEEYCAAVLFGINSMNSLAQNCNEVIWNYENYPEWKPSDDSFEILESFSKHSVPHEHAFRVDVSCAKMILRKIFDLRDKMRLGVQTGNILTNKPFDQSNPSHYFNKYPWARRGHVRLFYTDIFYEVSSFLKWMERCDYKRPKELDFEEKDGELIWVDLQCGEEESTENLGIDNVVDYLLKSNQDEMATKDVIRLLEKNNIHYNFNAMSSDEKRSVVAKLSNRGLRDRMIALILEWKRIERGDLKLKSAMRAISRHK